MLNFKFDVIGISETNYLNHLLDKMTEENKKIFLIGDFNVDLMKTDTDFNTSQFIDTMTSNLFVPRYKSYKDYPILKNINRL